MPPSNTASRITPQGRAAAGRIAEARQNLNNQQSTVQDRLSSVAPTKGTQLSPINSADATSFGNIPSITEIPAPAPTSDFSDIISRFRPADRSVLQAGAQDIRAAQEQLGTRAARGAELEAQFGLEPAYTESARLGQQIADLTSSFNQAIQGEEGFVRPMEFITGRQAYLQNQKAVQIESLAAAQAALDGNIALSEQRIEKALDREFGDLEAQLEAAKTEYQLNKDELERIDKDMADERGLVLSERERILQEAKDERKNVLDLMKTAAENGADAATLSRMAQAKTVDDALSVGGQFLQSVAGADFKTVGDSLVKINPDGTVEVVFGKGTGQTPSEVAAQGGSTYDIIASSDQFDKVMDATDRQSLTKAKNVADQLVTLSDMIVTARANGEDVGPFIGRIREANPWDVSAKEFEAAIKGIVPNLARGIYGEVGVLTDTDIANYSQTLPTLRSPEEVQDAMLGLTLKLIKNSVENQLITAAENGVNVSGNLRTLEELEKKVGQALAPINMKLPETQALIDAGANPQEIQSLYEAGYEPQEVEDYYLNGGTSQSGGEVSFNQAIDASANAIAAVESGGNYQALGPVLNSGSYAGDRAYGKYQVMGRNIPSWSQEILGYEVTPQQFLVSPQIQDAIFKGKFAQAAKEHGSLQDAASVWFSGRPLARAGNAKDQLGTSVPEYVKRFNQNLNLYA